MSWVNVRKHRESINVDDARLCLHPNFMERGVIAVTIDVKYNKSREIIKVHMTMWTSAALKKSHQICHQMINIDFCLATNCFKLQIFVVFNDLRKQKRLMRKVPWLCVKACKLEITANTCDENKAILIRRYRFFSKFWLEFHNEENAEKEGIKGKYLKASALMESSEISKLVQEWFAQHKMLFLEFYLYSNISRFSIPSWWSNTLRKVTSAVYLRRC